MKAKERRIEVWDISRINPYGKNAKIHTAEQVEKIAQSIDKFGFRGALGVKPDGELVTGHGRLLALKKLGFTTVNVEILEDMTEDEIKAYRLADNQAAVGKFDYELMKEDMIDIDASLLEGIFEKKEIDFLLEDPFAKDETAFASSLNDAVDEQRIELDSVIDGSKGKSKTLAAVLGFNSVPLSDAIYVTRFMADLQSRYGMEPEQAFLKFTRDHAASQVFEGSPA